MCSLLWRLGSFHSIQKQVHFEIKAYRLPWNSAHMFGLKRKWNLEIFFKNQSTCSPTIALWTFMIALTISCLLLVGICCHCTKLLQNERKIHLHCKLASISQLRAQSMVPRSRWNLSTPGLTSLEFQEPSWLGWSCQLNRSCFSCTLNHPEKESYF